LNEQAMKVPKSTDDRLLKLFAEQQKSADKALVLTNNNNQAADDDVQIVERRLAPVNIPGVDTGGQVVLNDCIVHNKSYCLNEQKSNNWARALIGESHDVIDARD
jgi:hypothetical protein